MIIGNVDLEVNGYEAILSKDIKLYRGDSFTLSFSLSQSFISRINSEEIIDGILPLNSNITATMLIENTYGTDYISGTIIEDNRIQFKILEEHTQAVGINKLQIVLEEGGTDILHIPEFEFEVRDALDTNGVEDQARVDYAKVDMSRVAMALDGDTEVNVNVNYTPWVTGELITAKRLNAIESNIAMLKDMLVKPPTYKAPTVTLKSSIGSAEVGSIITPTLTAGYNQNDGGSATSVVIKEGNITLSTTYTYVVPSFKLTADKTYSAFITYKDGAIKNDSMGNPYPTGQIKAGTVNGSLSIKAYRSYFAFVLDTGDTPTPTSIRNQAIKGLNLTNGSKVSISTTTNTRTVCFAYPSTLRDCTKIRYENLNDDENKSAFTSTLIDITDASGNNPIQYRVYYYISPVPFGTVATFTMTV